MSIMGQQADNIKFIFTFTLMNIGIYLESYFHTKKKLLFGSRLILERDLLVIRRSLGVVSS